MSASTCTVGILGAGKLGITLARLAADAGYTVLIHARPNPLRELTVSTLVPSATLVPFDDLITQSDLLILAIPHGAISDFDLSGVRGVIIDATNPWEATGADAGETIIPPAQTYPDLPIARTLNHISYEELSADAVLRPVGSEGSGADGSGRLRRAVAVWSNNPQAREVASAFVDHIGFDPVLISETDTALFNADGRLFGAWLSADELREQLRAAEF
ncbi:MAG: NAD(P)-dependent oxidoreductase [Corynebacterium sp.]|nr:NAD(P)-dependent oxidoreductase [Corynebacterium sp.]